MWLDIALVPHFVLAEENFTSCIHKNLCGGNFTRASDVSSKYVYSHHPLYYCITYTRSSLPCLLAIPRLACIMPIHLKFSCFTFSFNQIQLLTHQTDPYHHKEHVSKKWFKSNNRYLIYSKKSVFSSRCCCCCRCRSVSISVSQKPGKIQK